MHELNNLNISNNPQDHTGLENFCIIMMLDRNWRDSRDFLLLRIRETQQICVTQIWCYLVFVNFQRWIRVVWKSSNCWHSQY